MNDHEKDADPFPSTPVDVDEMASVGTQVNFANDKGQLLPAAHYLDSVHKKNSTTRTLSEVSREDTSMFNSDGRRTTGSGMKVSGPDAIDVATSTTSKHPSVRSCRSENSVADGHQLNGIPNTRISEIIRESASNPKIFSTQSNRTERYNDSTIESSSPDEDMTSVHKSAVRTSSETSLIRLSRISFARPFQIATTEKYNNRQPRETEFDPEVQRVFGVNRWAGFGTQGPQDFPRYHRMSGLLETMSPNMMAGDSNKETTEEMQTEHEQQTELLDWIVDSLPSVPEDAIGAEPMELDHLFPCLCPDERCNGKIAADFKKDARTWLWKSKRYRDQILNV